MSEETKPSFWLRLTQIGEARSTTDKTERAQERTQKTAEEKVEEQRTRRRGMRL